MCIKQKQSKLKEARKVWIEKLKIYKQLKALHKTYQKNTRNLHDIGICNMLENLLTQADFKARTAYTHYRNRARGIKSIYEIYSIPNNTANS